MTEYLHDKEQRQFERIPSKVNLTLTPLTESAAGDSPANAVSRDISENGIRFFSATRYKVGSSISLEIDLEGWQLFLRTVLKREDEAKIKPLTAIGKVVWSQTFPGSTDIQTGVQLIDINPDDLAAFKQYLHIIRETVREKM